MICQGHRGGKTLHYLKLPYSTPKFGGPHDISSGLFYQNPESISETFLKAQFFFLFYIDLFTALPDTLIYPLTYCQSSPVLMLNMGHFR